MDAIEQVEQWRNGIPSDLKWKELEPILDELGFEVKRATHGYQIWHPELQVPGTRRHQFMISDHYRGKKGAIHPNGIPDLLRHWTQVEEQRKDNQ